MPIEDIDKARHMAETEDPIREVGIDSKKRGAKPNVKAYMDREADFEAHATELDIEAIGESEYSRRKDAIAKILVETPMAVQYVMNNYTNEAYYKWFKSPEGSQIVEQLNQLFSGTKSLFPFFAEKEKQRRRGKVK